MKYIKSFENKTQQKLKYKVGDYVLLDMLEDEDFTYDECAGEIISCITNNTSQYTFDYVYDYRVQFFDNSVFDCDEGLILRKLTNKEIEDYNIKKGVLKYNL